MKHWTELRHHIDLSPYVDFYQDAVHLACEGKQAVLCVDVGVRDGCSSRIILDALQRESIPWRLDLVDPVKSIEAEELLDVPGVRFFEMFGEEASGNYSKDPIDFLHIDADPHGYEQTKVLFSRFARYVPIGGIVMFHDCTPWFGVHEVVKEGLGTSGQWALTYAKVDPQAPKSTPCMAVRLRDESIHEIYKNKALALVDQFVDPFVLKTDCWNEVNEIPIAPLIKNVFCLELSDIILDKAHNKFPKLRIRKGDIRKIPCENESVDVILDTSTIDHIPDYEKALDEYYRVLKLNGEALICVWLAKESSQHPSKYGGTQYFFNESSFVSDISSRFDIVSRTQHPEVIGDGMLNLFTVRKENG
jgi:hypothetical protein